MNDILVDASVLHSSSNCTFGVVMYNYVVLYTKADTGEMRVGGRIPLILSGRCFAQ